MSKPKRAGLYVRISLDRAGKALGVTRQEEDLRALATTLGWGVFKVYVENDTSASKGRLRPVYEQMKKDAEKGIIDGWLVYNVDRQTRRLSELAVFLDWRAKVGVPFATTEGDNTETANGVMVLQIKGALAQQEAARISERVIRANEQRRASGKPSIGGPRMFGFNATGDQVLPREAEVIQEGARMLLTGATYGEVMRHWASRGIGPTRAQTWTRESVRSVYRSGRVAGLVTYKGEVIGKSEYPAIIERQAWEAIAAAVIHGESKPQGYGSRVHALAGFVFCGACGATMVVQGDSYRCVKQRQGCGAVKRNKKWLDEYVDGFVRGALADESVAVDIPGESHEDEIADLELRIAAVRSQYASDGMDGEDFFPLLRELRSQITKLQKLDAEAVQSRARADVQENPLQVWISGTLTARRALLASLLKGVYVKPVGQIGRRPIPTDSIEIL